LRWATAAENSADRILHGTHPIGELNPRAKITGAVAKEIRGLRGVATQMAIAKRFGISQQTVSQIQSGKLWSSLSTQAG
jgi:DNA-binding XRE family transcriptional regulator